MSDGQNSIADDILRNGFERWQRLEGEKQAISDDLKELFAELKAQGFDGKALRAAFRDVAKVDDADVQEHNAVVDLYVNSLLRGRNAPVGTKNANAQARSAGAEWQAPRIASLGDQKDAYRAGNPISQDFQYQDASVYFFAFHEIGRIKIGVSNDVSARLADLSLQQGCEGEILHVMAGNRQAEMAAHDRFAEYRVEGEWFRDCAEVRAMIGEYKVAALRADPAMSIVDISNLKNKSTNQNTSVSEPFAPETGEFGTTPITEQQASPLPAVSDLTSPSQAPGQVAPYPVANVEEDADGAIAATSDDTASREVDDADRQQVAASGFSGDGGVGNTDPTKKYAAPGEVIWETHPPEGVERSPISMAFGNMGQDAAVIADDLEKGRAQPIVKKGKVILDGWCRYMTARDMRNLDGSPVAYPVVQYDGSDILIDMIKLNVEGRILTEQQKRLIAANLSRQQPKRKDDIYRAFELWMEPV